MMRSNVCSFQVFAGIDVTGVEASGKRKSMGATMRGMMVMADEVARQRVCSE